MFDILTGRIRPIVLKRFADERQLAGLLAEALEKAAVRMEESSPGCSETGDRRVAAEAPAQPAAERRVAEAQRSLAAAAARCVVELEAAAAEVRAVGRIGRKFVTTGLV